jgi:hypothetical protein
VKDIREHTDAFRSIMKGASRIPWIVDRLIRAIDDGDVVAFAIMSTRLKKICEGMSHCGHAFAQAAIMADRFNMTELLIGLVTMDSAESRARADALAIEELVNLDEDEWLAEVAQACEHHTCGSQAIVERARAERERRAPH